MIWEKYCRLYFQFWMNRGDCIVVWMINAIIALAGLLWWIEKDDLVPGRRADGTRIPPLAPAPALAEPATGAGPGDGGA